MKTFHLALLTLCTLAVCIANAAEYHPIEEVTVTTDENDLWPISNLIQGLGEGFAAEEPHDRLGAGSTHLWVTADDAGFPADYIEEVGQPVIQLDLGSDRTLKEISVWGYSSTNANGTSQFSLRFATEAEGDNDGIFGDVGYGESIAYNPTFELFSNPTPQQYKLFEETVVARYVELTNLDNFYIPPGDGSTPTEEPDPRLLPVLPGGDRVGLGEVAFMDLPDSFQPGDLIPRKINGDDFGTFEVGAARTGQVFGPAGDPAPGLAQEWYAVANPGSKEALDAVFNTNDPVVPAFRADGSSWWTGSSTALDGVPDYPAEVEAEITGDNYSVRLTGEILIEESGLYRFTDGVDDFAYFAIDADRSGVAGDGEDEVLINDNSWTDVLTGANNGGAIAEIDIQNVAEGGEWLAIQFNAAEGGGGDSGVLYWDYSSEDGVGGNEHFFPLEPQDAIFDEIDAIDLLVPDSHLRSSISELIGADASGSLADAIGQADVLELNLQVGPDGSDLIVLEDISVGEGSTVLDVSGATLRVQVESELTEGSEFQIFGADQVTGLDSLTLLFDDQSQWDLSRLDSGIIVFGPGSGLAGDIDGDGTVAFVDFLILSANFGNDVAVNMSGDLDGDGTVAFADFLILSANFGQSAAGAQPVPEPTSLALLGIAGLVGGLFRRRRNQLSFT